MSGICNVIIGVEKDFKEGTKHLSSIQRGIKATGSLCSQVKGQGAAASSSSLANSQLPKVSSGVKCMSHIASRRSSHEMFLDNFLLSYLSFLCLQAMLFLVAVGGPCMSPVEEGDEHVKLTCKEFDSAT